MEKESTPSLLKDYGIAVVLAIAVALTIRFFLIEAYRIPSTAMKPTLEAGDTIFVSKSAFGLRLPGSSRPFLKLSAPQRGDVVIFSTPATPGRDFIKRVIGLPGDRVEIRKNTLLLNDKPLLTTATGDTLCGQETLPDLRSYPVCWEPPLPDDFGPELVPTDSVFVIGDLRSNPVPATQAWKIIPQDSLKGKALWIWLSVEPGDFERSSFFPRFRFERMFRRIQ